jgi:hypothetical protein
VRLKKNNKRVLEKISDPASSTEKYDERDLRYVDKTGID